MTWTTATPSAPSPLSPVAPLPSVVPMTQVPPVVHPNTQLVYVLIAIVVMCVAAFGWFYLQRRRNDLQLEEQTIPIIDDDMRTDDPLFTPL